MAVSRASQDVSHLGSEAAPVSRSNIGTPCVDVAQATGCAVPAKNNPTNRRNRPQRNQASVMDRTLMGAERPKRSARKFKLDSATKELVRLKVDEIIATMGLTPYLSRIDDDRAVEDATKKAYEKHLRGLSYFFAMIGDYESLIILEYDAPENAPAMNVDSIRQLHFWVCIIFELISILVLYMDWRTIEESSPLFRKDNSQLMSYDGNPILASGTWADPNNITQLGSAIRALHERFHLRGAYQGVCPTCLTERQKDPPNRFGCDRHAPTPFFWRKGNPTESVEFSNAFKRIKKDMKTYQVHGDSILTYTD